MEYHGLHMRPKTMNITDLEWLHLEPNTTTITTLFNLYRRFCIPNGVPVTTEYRRLRLNEEAHPLAYMNDGDSSTTWISGVVYMPGGIMITLDLENGEYQVIIFPLFWNECLLWLQIYFSYLHYFTCVIFFNQYFLTIWYLGHKNCNPVLQLPGPSNHYIPFI